MGVFIEYIVLVALVAAFIITLARKRGMIEYMQVHGNDFLSEMAGCDFCLSWWAGVCLSAVTVLYTGDAIYMSVPFFSTMITKKIIS